MKKIFITSLALVGMTALPVMAEADTAAKAEASKPVAPVICPGYKAGTTQLPSQRTGRKIGSALEAYNQDLIAESLEILIDIDPSDGFDKAYVNRFIGNIMATQEGQGDKALDYLNKSVSPKELNDREHADTLRLIGDLSMQQQKYQNALQHYQKWMDFTCKEDDKIYTRMAQAYYELKDLPAMVAPASRAIEIQEKKDKNPYVLKMTSFYERKMYPQTVAVAEDLVRVFPEEKRWWSQLGFFYMLVEDYPKALSTFEMAYLQGYLEKSSEIRALSQLYATSGMPHKAADVLEEGLKAGLLKKEKRIYSQLANAHHSAKDFISAAKVYAIAADFDNDLDLRLKQANLLLIAERYRQALEVYAVIADSDYPNKGKVYFSMMEASFYLGNYRKAYEYAKEAKKDASIRRNANAWMPYIKEKAKNRGINI